MSNFLLVSFLSMELKVFLMSNTTTSKKITVRPRLFSGKKTFFTITLIVAAITFASAQDIIKGLPLTITLVPKSAKTPNLKFKDGSGISLKYDAESGIHVLMNKNGK